MSSSSFAAIGASRHNVQPAALEQLLLSTPATTFKAGKNVFREGDPAQSVILVASGVLRASRFLVDGRRGVMRFLFGGEFLGLYSHDRHQHAAEVIVDAKIHRFPRERLYEMCETAPELRKALFASISEETAAAQEQLLMLGQKNAEERVASFLIWIARRTGSLPVNQPEAHVPMNRTDVADYLGLTVETVCRVMTKLKHLNYIATCGRHTVVLLRLAELHRFAGECDDSLGTRAQDMPFVANGAHHLANKILATTEFSL